jgi:hypothetical protein
VKRFFGFGAAIANFGKTSQMAPTTDRDMAPHNPNVSILWSMTLALHQEHMFSDMFLARLLARNIR